MSEEVEAAVKLARDALSKSLPQRWCHVQGVARRVELARQLFSDHDYRVLSMAAILHDVGYSSDIARSGFHPLDGALYLDSHGIESRVCGLVAFHSCAYLEAELRGLSVELAQWTDERTALSDALWWADMTTTPDGGPTSVHDRIEEIQKRYGPEHLVTFFIRQAEPELVAAVERTEDRLRAAEIDYTAK